MPPSVPRQDMDDSRPGDAAVENLVPADQPPAVTPQKTFDARGGVALQLPRTGQSLGAHPLPAPGTLAPTGVGRTFVASYMNIGRRKESDDLLQHPFDKAERRVASDAENTVVDVPCLAHLILLPRAAQPRIGSQCGHRMSRKFNLGNDRDETAAAYSTTSRISSCV